jgi:hypothetical protein
MIKIRYGKNQFIHWVEVFNYRIVIYHFLFQDGIRNINIEKRKNNEWFIIYRVKKSIKNYKIFV